MSYATLARFYDLLHADLTEDVAFVAALAQDLGGRVLELGCGTGRLLRPLAEAGCRVTGVDNSAEMLAIAHTHLAAHVRVQTVKLIQTDMTRLSLPDAVFDLAVLSYNTVLHLTAPQLQTTLRRVHSVIRPNGVLLIDTINPVLLAEWPDQPEPSLETTFIEPASGATVTQWSSNRAVPGEQAVTVTWRFDVDAGDDSAEQIRSTVTYHYQYAHEWQLLLLNAGWQLRDVWGEYDQTPYDEDTPRLLLLARRPPD